MNHKERLDFPCYIPKKSIHKEINMHFLVGISNAIYPQSGDLYNTPYALWVPFPHTKEISHPQVAVS